MRPSTDFNCLRDCFSSAFFSLPLVGVKESDPSPVSARLVPFADLLNHSFTPTLIHTVSETGDISLRASRDIEQGEELTLKYRDENDGDACSFLLHYGFWPCAKSCGASVSSEIRFFFRVKMDVEELGVEDSALSRAIASLGLAPSPDMALPATESQPLPPLWIWLLRLKGMTEAQRISFSQGQVEVPFEVEQESWRIIRAELERCRAWYVQTGGGGELKAAEECSGDTSTLNGLRREVHRTALVVTASALLALPPH